MKYTLIAMFGISAIAFFLYFCRLSYGPNGFENRARAEVTMIASAIEEFRSNYGVNPVHEKDFAPLDQGKVYSVLMAIPGDCYWTNINTGGVVYLTGIPRSSHGKWLDPWGNAYNMIIADTNTSSVVVGGAVVNRPAVVWSNGENRINDYGKGDDITSWASWQK